MVNARCLLGKPRGGGQYGKIVSEQRIDFSVSEISLLNANGTAGLFASDGRRLDEIGAPSLAKF